MDKQGHWSLGDLTMSVDMTPLDSRGYAGIGCDEWCAYLEELPGYLFWREASKLVSLLLWKVPSGPWLDQFLGL